jgi:hypothetical protein
MKHGIGIVTVGALMFAGLMSGTANADIIITFTEALDGGFTMVGTGSGSIRLGKTDDDFDLKDFNTNYLVAGSFQDKDATSVGGTLKNITTGSTVGVEKFEVDEDGTGSNNDVAIKTDAEITFATGDLFEIDFVGTYLEGNVAFSSLVVGTHTMTSHTGSDEIFGDVTVNVVPAAAAPTPGTVFIIQ